MNKNYLKGIEVLTEMTGTEGKQTLETLKEIFPDFEEKIIAFGFGEVYSRPNLDLKMREVVTMTALISQGAFDQLGFHMKAALRVGLKPEEILEIILHCALYVGFPKACSALGLAGEVLKENK